MATSVEGAVSKCIVGINSSFSAAVDCQEWRHTGGGLLLFLKKPACELQGYARNTVEWLSLVDTSCVFLALRCRRRLRCTKVSTPTVVSSHRKSADGRDNVVKLAPCQTAARLRACAANDRRGKTSKFNCAWCAMRRIIIAPPWELLSNNSGNRQIN